MTAPTTFDDLVAPSPAAQPPAPVAQRPPEFVPPPVRVGDTVYWYPAAKHSKQPAPAIVTGVEGNVVWLTIFAKGKMPLPTRDAIRHVADPHLLSHPNVAVKDGAWGHRG